jgi:MarR family transcriptional regulator for hemolysin
VTGSDPKDLHDNASQARIPLGRRISVTGKLMRELADVMLAPEGASLTTWIVLHHTALAGSEPGLSQRQLAANLHIGGPALVRHLDRLEQEGLLRRTRDTADRRITRITLTPAGEAKLEQLRIVMEHSDESIRAELTERETEVLEQALDTIHRYAIAKLHAMSGSSQLALHLDEDLERRTGAAADGSAGRRSRHQTPDQTPVPDETDVA